MNGRCLASELSMSKANQAMGAFLTKVKDCEFFWAAALPYWLIRSAEHHPTVRIDQERVPITPESLHICTDDIMSHKRQVIYAGALHDLKKTVAVEKYGIAIVNYSNDPFSLPAVEPSDTASSSSIGPSRTKPKQQRQKPYNSGKSKTKKQAQPQVERDKFVEIRGPYSPEIPEVWVEALGSIDKSRRPTKSQVPNGAASAWSAKQWRILLGTGDEHTAKEGSHMADKRAEIQKLLGRCLEDSGLTYEKKDTYHFTWQDIRRPIGTLSEPRIVQQITWELFELNFRMELHGLNRLFSSSFDPTDPFSPAVQACFGKMKGVGSPAQTDIKDANCGLAAAEPKHRWFYF
ncbi:hypothetical protein V5O48_002406 [Marasmius crinis-equi]|uniref:Uncharacterized protein n=1 Tax=Marasmius crinis-equi TaxID=585013 RepID=A0ABR3FVX1_9AGAR